MKRKANFPLSSYSDLMKIQKTDNKKADITTSNFNYSQLRQQQQKQTPQISYANLRKNASTSIPATQVPQQQQFSTRPPNSLSKTLENIREKGESQIPLKMDANKILHKIPLAGHLKVMLDPDLEKLKRYAKRKQLLKHHRDKLIKAGKIKPLPKNNKSDETLKVDDQQEVNIRMNEKGELRDDKGNLIKLDQNRFNLRINKKQKQQDKYKQMIKLAQQNSIRHTLIYDQNVTISSTTNKRLKQKSHALHFLEKKNPNKSEIIPENILSNEIMDLETFLQKTNIPDENISTDQNENIISQKRISLKVKHHDPIPNVEWWDIPLFNDQEINSYFQEYYSQINSQQIPNPENHEQNIEILQQLEFDSQFYQEKAINNLVEHPEGFTSPFNHTNNAIIPFFLTTKERKKIKRKRKMDKQRDMQDKLKLGLIEPPPPKVKLSNMLNVFQTDAVSDPSKIEQEVRSQIQARLFKHLQSNAARKLNSEQKYDKTIKKLKKDSTQECRVALFRIENLQHGQQRFKVDKNAQTLQMHGVCLIPSYEDGFNCPVVLVVEGGPKAIKRYKKLLLFRIKWQHGALNDDEEQKKINLEKNKCVLVWEGVIKEHAFKQWKVLDIKNEMEGKRALSERNVEYYWDKVMNYYKQE